MRMSFTLKTEASKEPCVFCGGEMRLAESGGSAGMCESSSHWREECKRCFSSKIGTNDRISFERSGHPLSYGNAAASAIKARRAADSEAGAVHESAGPKGDAHE